MAVGGGFSVIRHHTTPSRVSSTSRGSLRASRFSVPLRFRTKIVIAFGSSMSTPRVLQLGRSAGGMSALEELPRSTERQRWAQMGRFRPGSFSGGPGWKTAIPQFWPLGSFRPRAVLRPRAASHLARTWLVSSGRSRREEIAAALEQVKRGPSSSGEAQPRPPAVRRSA
jgi:hypothetical protein